MPMTFRRRPPRHAPAATGSLWFDRESGSVCAEFVETPSTVDFQIGDRRIWSVRGSQFAVAGGGVRTLDAPEAFRTSLTGSGLLTAIDSPSGRVLAEGEIVTGDPRGELRLTDRFGRPAVVDKWGNTSRTLADGGPEVTERLMANTRAVIRAVAEFGLDPFLVGGTLLGIVREGRLLPHDDDTDLGYLSRHETPADVVLESFQLERALLAAGFTVLRHSGVHLQVTFPSDDGPDYYVDIFGSMHRSGFFHQPVQVRARLPRGDYDHPRTISFDGHEYPIPRDPEAWLEANYGPGWRVPDPTFRFVTPATTERRFLSWFGSFNSMRAFWDDHWAREAPSIKREPSRLAVWLSEHEDRAFPILDVGCGDGSDSRFLRSLGFDVRGADFSEQARARAAVPDGSNAPPSVDDLNLNNRRAVLRYALEHAEPVVLATSRVIASIVDPSRTNLVLLAKYLAPGSVWYVDFPTELDRDYRFEDPTSWHLTVDGFRDLATAQGLTIDRLEQSTVDGRPTAFAVVRKEYP